MVQQHSDGTFKLYFPVLDVTTTIAQKLAILKHALLFNLLAKQLSGVTTNDLFNRHVSFHISCFKKPGMIEAVDTEYALLHGGSRALV